MTDEATPADVAEASQRKAARNASKLGALVRERWDVGAPHSTVGTGAAMVVDDRAFVLLDGDHGLGAAIAWSRRSGASELHVIADDGPGTVARQASEFASSISVWTSDGRALTPATPTEPDEGRGPPDAPELVAVLEAEGLDVVVEGDRLAGEYRGLEVVRIVRALDNDEPILEVGVGRFDRELTTMMHGDLPDAASVTRVVQQLREIRRPGGRTHPLGTLVPERWLRHTLIAEPSRIGVDDLVAAPTPNPRDRLRDRGVAAAVGTRGGAPVVVACTVGVDLEAVVLAADARRAIDPDATLLLALPSRDVLPVVEAMMADLLRPSEVAAVEGDWKT